MSDLLSNMIVFRLENATGHKQTNELNSNANILKHVEFCLDIGPINLKLKLVTGASLFLIILLIIFIISTVILAKKLKRIQYREGRNPIYRYDQVIELENINEIGSVSNPSILTNNVLVQLVADMLPVRNTPSNQTQLKALQREQRDRLKVYHTLELADFVKQKSQLKK